MDHANNHKQPQSMPEGRVFDFIDHLDDWLEYLTKVLELSRDDRQTCVKYERQIKYLIRFRQGANSNINHNRLLHHHYSNKSLKEGDNVGFNGIDDSRQRRQLSKEAEQKVKEIIAEANQVMALDDMALKIGAPIQKGYNDPCDNAFEVIKSAMSTEDLYFLQGPPGTGKTTAIVEMILQTLKAKPNARILVASETHVAVDNALDRLCLIGDESIHSKTMRYPRYAITEYESKHTAGTAAEVRANEVWNQALEFAPQLTNVLYNVLEQGELENGEVKVPRWQFRNLADNHQIIGVTCNQIDHLLDEDSEDFDLVIVDECSKATLPEWIMAMSVGRKCILVGDHKQLPPTFCEEESDALDTLAEAKARLIKDGVIDKIFEHLPITMKGQLSKQYRMLPHIGSFISKNFYNGNLRHHREDTDHDFTHFGWFTYDSRGYRVPIEHGGVLENQREIEIITHSLVEMCSRRKFKAAKSTQRKLSVAVITPYRAQCRALREAINKLDIREYLSVEVDTVDAFQGRQADIVFFSFVRTTGPATFYADSRRMNVAISRARDAVYLIGDRKYIKSKNINVLNTLLSLGVVEVE
ncbi:DEAD/DEAH box helicase [Cupriavidus basilensis]|uniref:DEAD/DEAH box helicase n=1 Tax=Cupriavidus basilensis TaxID=68895 RepID=UPI0023E77DE6|nr:AAA domain-containing protein [Cupriavidus basilensis]MDF3887012.1 AAA domain-containing protein [Cupriavidus basilensis]